MRTIIGFTLFLAICTLAGPALAAAPGAKTPAGRAPLGYTVQLIPYPTQAEAERMVTQLAAKGYHPYVFEGTDIQGKQWFAVRTEDFSTIAEARKALAEFKGKERLPAFVTPRGGLVPVSAEAPVTVAATAPEATSPSPTGPTSARAAASPAAATSETPPPVTPTNPLPTSATLTDRDTAAKSSPPAGTADLNSLKAQMHTLQKKMASLEQEAEARKILRMTKEEENKQESEVLSAAGREYTLIPRNILGLEYNLQYDYFSSDVLENVDSSRLKAERHGNHTLTNSIFAEYGLRNNVTINGSLPFVYEYDKWGQDGARQVTDLGDIDLGLQYQPFKANSATWPASIFGLDATLPTGRSPYKINPDTDLATGAGTYSLGASATFSKTLDPVVAFGSLNYTHRFETGDAHQVQSNGTVLTKVKPGDSIGFSVGLGYALSYKTSLNLTYQYAYHLGSRYEFDNGTSMGSGSYVNSSFSIGAGWRISPRYSVFVKTGIGLTNDDPDFTFAIRIPVQFDLGK